MTEYNPKASEPQLIHTLSKQPRCGLACDNSPTIRATSLRTIFVAVIIVRAKETFVEAEYSLQCHCNIKAMFDLAENEQPQVLARRFNTRRLGSRESSVGSVIPLRRLLNWIALQKFFDNISSFSNYHSCDLSLSPA